jgi:hypothetical protein
MADRQESAMPSISYRRWTHLRANALDEIAQAHAAVGGTKRGRRYATQQINHAYAVLLASQFQGFCRDLHSECLDHLVAALAPAPALLPLMQAEFVRGRQLDFGNAQPASIGADFGRLGLDFWTEAVSHDLNSQARKEDLSRLNEWRNAIAHQKFDPAKLEGTTILRLTQVRRWRVTCRHLARVFDEVMRRRLQALLGTSPW